MSYHHALARNHISKTRGQWLNSHTFDGHNCPREPDDQNYFEVIVQKLKIEKYFLPGTESTISSLIFQHRGAGFLK